MDADNNYTNAAAEFRTEYTGAAMVNAAQKGDLVDVQYSDGTIVEFTIFANWRYSMETWDPDKVPKVKQGPYPKSRGPIGLYQPNGNPITYTLYAMPTASTPTYTVTVTQFGGGCEGCTSTTSGTGSPSPGGGGGGGTDPTPCDDCDDKNHQ